ncbi:MAG: DUF3990 domain-containing protein [Victivallales bacterium]|jgi:hypothetical protein|nr:DUF3990 domain-containing protein [Victivallales bacterium]
MIVYHGGIAVIESPQILRQEVGRDFGAAFYTTDIRDQAERWARRKALVAGRKNDQAILPVVNEYEFALEAARKSLKIHRFEGSSPEWLDLVLQCRANAAFRHPFDIVIGNIANDNVGETVSYVQQGIMRKEDALERLKFEKLNNQIAFCTESALEFLRFKSHFTNREATND